MTTTFFSVDVETTSPNPFKGQLLSVGIVPIDGETLEIHEGLHIPIDYDPDGYIDPATLEWWKDQDEAVYDVAWGLNARLSKEVAASVIKTFVTSFSDVIHERVFCANPVSFDYPWLLKLFAETGNDNPWSHRTVCMRSMYFGITGGKWGEKRETGDWHYPDQPHHALSDAEAQAYDFIKMYMMTHADKRSKVSVSAVSDVYD